VRRLILTGLGEHFGWIDETRNPDLDDIAAHYTERGHTFVVAEMHGEIVGAAALKTEDETTGRIVRMSVAQSHRRQGIGRALAHISSMWPVNKASHKCASRRNLIGTLQSNCTPSAVSKRMVVTIRIFSSY